LNDVNRCIDAVTATRLLTEHGLCSINGDDGVQTRRGKFSHGQTIWIDAARSGAFGQAIVGQ